MILNSLFAFAAKEQPRGEACEGRARALLQPVPKVMRSGEIGGVVAPVKKKGFAEGLAARAAENSGGA
ncbi:hypothetical protein [Variovorax sp. KBW07]|uniref:hypothetical protein n=1 Tax=Variovorax sp. KBW07 TaxID=2153358 RepID=UPI000F56455C|nr:hypothetical protein [Variovorax sp. KBW07]